MAFEYAHLIEQYGYAATFAGTLIEGETLLILSGLAAHRGYLTLPLVIVVGALGGMLGDLAYFAAGRRFGDRLLARFPRFGPAAERVRTMIERHPNATIVGVRFMYGLRTAGPAVIGTTRIGVVQFVLLNAVGALLWSTCWAGAGYVLGSAAERLLGDVARAEKELFGVALLLAVLVGVGVRMWQRRRRAG